jgi:peroxiredoxin (alkyl hydroperoxide reductase subunit C)
MKLGDQIQDFEFDAYHNGEFIKGKLSDHKGKWVVLFFYPKDFTFVCPTEIRAFAKRHSDFQQENAVVIGASTDSVESHKAWFQRDIPEVNYPVIGDTSHAITDYFNILKPDGTAHRGTFIIDPEGELKYMVVSHHDVGRSIEETLRVLKAFKTGSLCPINWKPGEQTLT